MNISCNVPPTGLFDDVDDELFRITDRDMLEAVNGKICGKYTTSAYSKMALKYRCRFCLSFDDAKHATNLFTMEAKHANLLGRLRPIFLVALTEAMGMPSFQVSLPY